MRLARVRLSAAVASMLLAACGGGGSGGSPLPDPPPNAQELVQQALETCVRASLDELLAVQQILEAAASGGQQPDFRTTGVDLSNFSAPGVMWAGDLDGDMVDDVTGTSRLGGLSLEQMLALVAALSAPSPDYASIFAGLPSGTAISSDFVATLGPNTSTGDVVLVMSNPTGQQAVPDATSGTLITSGLVCDVTWSWSDLAIADLATQPYPIAEFDFDAATAQGHILGTVHMNGTNQATIETVLLPSQFQSDFLLDLDTGLVTPL